MEIDEIDKIDKIDEIAKYFSCRHKRKMEAKRVKLGIMEAVEEAGVDHLLSDRESTPGRQSC